jgi:hypothetical protein
LVGTLGCGSDRAATTDAPATSSEVVVTKQLAGAPSGSSSCLPASIDPRDVDPNDPGVQADCTVTDIENLGSSDETQQLVPDCTMSDPATVSPASPTPCWWTDDNATSCPDAPNLELELVVGATSIPPDTTTVIDCVWVGA